MSCIICLTMPGDCEVTPARVQALQAAMDALQAEQAAQREAISAFKAQLTTADNQLQACTGAVEVLTEQHGAADTQLRSMHSAMTEQQVHLTELAAECDRRHETAMKMQQTTATEAALLGQQVCTPLFAQGDCTAHMSLLFLWFLVYSVLDEV